jgi:hypothetical protein
VTGTRYTQENGHSGKHKRRKRMDKKKIPEDCRNEGITSVLENDPSIGSFSE